mmetsp:Transcript_120624/g.335909  ORF Transcript_120624/g.335909 Transcript_120624/m.335909 type:complete len:221 (+) Transcript_120624:127-789(+)
MTAQRAAGPSAPAAHEGPQKLLPRAHGRLLEHLLGLRGVGHLRLIDHLDPRGDLVLVHLHDDAVIDDLVEDEQHVRETVEDKLLRQPGGQEGGSLRDLRHGRVDAFDQLQHSQLVLGVRRDGADDDVIASLEEHCIVVDDRNVHFASAGRWARELADHPLLEGELLHAGEEVLLRDRRKLHGQPLPVGVQDEECPNLTEPVFSHGIPWFERPGARLAGVA